MNGAVQVDTNKEFGFKCCIYNIHDSVLLSAQHFEYCFKFKTKALWDSCCVRFLVCQQAQQGSILSEGCSKPLTKDIPGNHKSRPFPHLANVMVE